MDGQGLEAFVRFPAHDLKRSEAVNLAIGEGDPGELRAQREATGNTRKNREGGERNYPRPTGSAAG